MSEFSDITVRSQRDITVTGVDGIVSFSETEAVLSTSLGFLAVTGSGFVFDGYDKDNGTAQITGKINAVFYPGGKKDKRSFFKKLFG